MVEVDNVINVVPCKRAFVVLRFCQNPCLNRVRIQKWKAPAIVCSLALHGFEMGLKELSWVHRKIRARAARGAGCNIRVTPSWGEGAPVRTPMCIQRALQSQHRFGFFWVLRVLGFQGLGLSGFRVFRV